MTPREFDALVEQGLDALKAAKGLSAEEQQKVDRAIARIAANSVEAPAEEPKPKRAKDSEPEPKAEPTKARRSTPAGRGKKGT